MYNANPRNIFQEKINSILKRESSNMELFETIFKLQQMIVLEKFNSPAKKDPDQWKILMELFTSLGSTTFAKVVSIAKGKTISFPSEEEYQDSIITTLCYYYKEIENISWEEIKEVLNMPSLNAIK
jgi:hypothetical protein